MIVLLLVGTGALIFALWLTDHRQAAPSAETIIIMLAGVLFVSYTWAFVWFLRWRDKRRLAMIRPEPPTALARPDLKGTVYGMIPGLHYQVLKPFTDERGNSFKQGELLRFKERHFLPYDSGHTIIFEERPLYLQDEKNREILDHFSEYIAQIEQ